MGTGVARDRRRVFATAATGESSDARRGRGARRQGCGVHLHRARFRGGTVGRGRGRRGVRRVRDGAEESVTRPFARVLGAFVPPAVRRRLREWLPDGRTPAKRFGAIYRDADWGGREQDFYSG